MSQAFIEVGPQGIVQVVINQATAAERRETMLFLAGKLEALDRFNHDLRTPDPAQAVKPTTVDAGTL
jgi:hypothetical protein